jgi:phosphoglycerate dehydrogenase-like enzyme
VTGAAGRVLVTPRSLTEAALDGGTLSRYAVDRYDTEPPGPSPLLQPAGIRRATSDAVENLLAALGLA